MSDLYCVEIESLQFFVEIDQKLQFLDESNLFRYEFSDYEYL